MTVRAGAPQPLSRQALAVLRHPDQRTSWTVVLVASIDPRHSPRADRIGQLNAELPMIGSRVHNDRWVPGPAPRILDLGDEDPLDFDGLLRPFSLHEDAPLRVVIGAAGGRVALVGHHAAFDGRALVSLLDALLGGSVPPPPATPAAGGSQSKRLNLERLLRPMDRIAASHPRPRRDALAVRDVSVSGPRVTARLAAACAAAGEERNRSRGTRWNRFGISVGVGGPAGAGNVASYRRVDLTAGAPVERAIAAALADSAEPPELVSSPRMLRMLAPVARRFSDTLLVSNLGLVDVPRAHRVEFFPVARGRSAVAFGLATIAGGAGTLCLRARDLDTADADALLDAAARHLEETEA